MNQARLQILQAREQQIKVGEERLTYRIHDFLSMYVDLQDVLEEARSRLSRVSMDQGRYRDMLEGLILQVS